MKIARRTKKSLDTRPILPLADAGTAAPEEPIYRLAVAQYLAMIDAAILIEDDPVELLEGWLVHKVRKSPPHVLVTNRVRRELETLVATDWDVASHELVVTEDSVPETDVMLARRGRPDYLEQHPGPRDVPLIVEIADATLARDRGMKKRVYARAGIPVYWIANLVEGKFEVYTDPSGPIEEPDYGQSHEYGPEDTLPIVLDGAEIGRLTVRELLP